MKKREPITHIMTANVHTVNHKNSLYDAERLMRNKHIRHIPVVSGDKLVGILSLTDLKRISFVDSYAQGDGEGAVDTAIYDMLTIEQVMVNKPVSVQIDATIRDVAEILSKNEFHAVPVLEGEKLVGIVTTTDLIKYLLDQY